MQQASKIWQYRTFVSRQLHTTMHKLDARQWQDAQKWLGGWKLWRWGGMSRKEQLLTGVCPEAAAYVWKCCADWTYWSCRWWLGEGIGFLESNWKKSSFPFSLCVKKLNKLPQHTLNKRRRLYWKSQWVARCKKMN